MAADLAPLLTARRVLLCVGCGGVGKTTTCAALGLAAARRGQRVLCLTIDPARRLAESLGLTSLSTEAQQIAPAVFAEADLDVTGSLTVMMLDTKSTFDGLVSSLAETAERRESILHNVIYQYISSSLAGTQEYMAMEKLYAVQDDPAYDLILLDTPPTSHALDFLDAPEKLVSAIDSAAVRWFVQAFQKSTLSLNLLQRSAQTVLKGIGRITGAGFLEQVATFISEMNDLFGGWRARADQVASALRSPSVGYVLVTSPQVMAIREVLFFASRLREHGMTPSAYVVNRVHEPAVMSADAADVQAVLDARGIALESDGAARVLEAARQGARLAELDRLHLYKLDEAFGDGDDARPLIVRVPELPRDIHDLRRLAWVSDVLCPTPSAPRRASG